MRELVPNCFYNKLRITHDLCRIVWFIQKHGVEDARRAGDKDCSSLFDKIAHELEEYIEELKETLCEETHTCANCSER